jgi:hypothetical protein
MTESALYKIDKLLEELSGIDYTNLTPPGAAPQGEGKGVGNSIAQSNQLLAGYKNSVQAKMDDTRQHLTRANDDARAVDPGTGMSALEQTAGTRLAYRVPEAEAKERNSLARLMKAQQDNEDDDSSELLDNIG